MGRAPRATTLAERPDPSAPPTAVAAGAVASCNEDHIGAQELHWSNHGALAALDAKSVRRGFQVYKEVCASCHSVERLAFRNLVEYGAWSEEEVKAMAEEVEIVDGPNDEGEMFERPGKLSDYMPGPYANEEAGRAANNGALPPDLSLIVKARHGGADYVFSLCQATARPRPARPCFLVCITTPTSRAAPSACPHRLMGRAGRVSGRHAGHGLADGEGRRRFLAWVAEPEHDERKKGGFRWITALGLAALVAGYTKRRWANLKARKITPVPSCTVPLPLTSDGLGWRETTLASMACREIEIRGEDM